MNLKESIIILILLFAGLLNLNAKNQNNKTFCNPLDLAYRFQFEGSYREAADPVIVLYKNQYWLFASKSGGYWFSDKLVNWTFIETTELPVEIYAPAVIAMNDSLYYLAGKNVYVTTHPESGKWKYRASINHEVSDPALFLDDNNRLYLFHGCKENRPLIGVELDKNSFLFIGDEKEIIYPDSFNRGWEVAGNTNEGKIKDVIDISNYLPWIEGSWMNKLNGKYYWQYAAPGTQFRSYADGVFVSDSILTGYHYTNYSPFSYKPAGFVTGTGHSCTFQDKNKGLWHVTSANISVRHRFERRSALFPTTILQDGQLVTNTYLGDYPQFIQRNNKKPLDTFAGWMLLSYRKPAKASSTQKNEQNLFIPENALDEDITTWWSATTGEEGEWFEVDLLKQCKIHSIQINFADENAKVQGRLRNDGYGYKIEISKNGLKWVSLYDNTLSIKDQPHHYFELNKVQTARFIRITNSHSPAGSNFSISGLRVFGKTSGNRPEKVQSISALRNKNDKRSAVIKWEPAAKADFYIIRYGIAPNKLYSSYPVYNTENIKINSLNSSTKYYLTIDAINECGITKGRQIFELK